MIAIERNHETHEWDVVNTATGIRVGSHWTLDAARQQVAEIEARIAAKQERDRALYAYGN